MTDRHLEVRVLWDGLENPALHVKKFEIDSHRYEACNTAVLTFVREETSFNGNALWFEEGGITSPWVSIEIRDLRASSTAWTILFQGRVDHVRVLPQYALVEMECRDALAALVDLRVQDAWLNHTGADLLAMLAQAAGLEARISFLPDMPDQMTGQFWQVEHKRGAFLSQHCFQTAADLAFSVAREAMCDLYADGKTIVCQPIGNSSEAKSPVDTRGNVFTIDISRDLQLLSGFVVHVASWDSRQRNSTHVYYDGKTFLQDAPETDKMVHSFRLPGRRLEELRRLARGKYERIAAHAMSARLSMPGVIGLEPRQYMRIATGQSADVLGVDQVISRFSLEEGFVQHIVLRRRGGEA